MKFSPNRNGLKRLLVAGNLGSAGTDHGTNFGAGAEKRIETIHGECGNNEAFGDQIKKRLKMVEVSQLSIGVYGAYVLR